MPVQRNRRPSIAANPSYDWSTSYQAGSSGCVAEYPFIISLVFHASCITPSAASTTCSDTGDSNTDTDDDCATLRGRSTSDSRPTRHHTVKSQATDTTKTRRGSVSSTSGSSGPQRLQPRRISFTRSKSPLPPAKSVNDVDASPSFRKASPTPFRIKQGITYQHILPPAFYFSFRIPFSENVRRFHIDSSKACETILLLVSMVFAGKSLTKHRSETWISIGGFCLHSALNADLNETPHTPPFT